MQFVRIGRDRYEGWDSNEFIRAIIKKDSKPRSKDNTRKGCRI